MADSSAFPLAPLTDETTGERLNWEAEAIARLAALGEDPRQYPKIVETWRVLHHSWCVRLGVPEAAIAAP